MLSGLTAFDAAVLIIIALSTLFAFGKGLVHITLGLAAWAGAFFAAIFGFQIASPYIRDLISPPELADIITLVTLFFVALFILKIIAAQIGRMVKESPVGILDRSLGALFGVVRGMIIIAISYLALTKLSDEEQWPDWITDAKLRPLVAWSAEMMEGFAQRMLGQDPHKTGENYIAKIKNTAKDQFIQEKLEKQAAQYKDKARDQLDDLFDIVTDDGKSEDKKKPELEG